MGATSNKDNPEWRKVSLSSLWEHNNAYDCGVLDACCASPHVFSGMKKFQCEAALAADLITLGYQVLKAFEVTDEHLANNASASRKRYFVVDKQNKGQLDEDLTRLKAKYRLDNTLYVPKGGMNSLVGVFEQVIATDVIFGSSTNARLAEKWAKEFEKHNVVDGGDDVV